MSKELEALEAFGRITLHTEYDNDSSYDCLNFEEDCNLVEQALTEYEAINNAEPTKALECLKRIIRGFNETAPNIYGIGEVVVENELEHYYSEELTAIKQALIQKSKKEQALDIVVKKNVDMLLVKKYDNASDYNSAVWFSGRDKLTDDEFNTLKESVGE